LSVCTRPIGDSEFGECVDVPKDETPGPSLVELIGGEEFEVVVVASEMTADDGDFVIIDNLEVSYESCSSGELLAGGVQ